MQSLMIFHLLLPVDSGNGEGEKGGNHRLCHEVNRVQLSIARGHFRFEKKMNLHLLLPLSLISVLIWQIF